MNNLFFQEYVILQYKTEIMKLNHNKIRAIRINKGFSQEYVSSILGISQAKYSRIENGKIEITIGELGKLIQALEIDPLEILIVSNKLQQHLNKTG